MPSAVALVTVNVAPVSPVIAVVPLNHCKVCVPEGVMLDVNTTDEPVQKEVGPFAVITGVGFPVTFIALLVFVHAPTVLTTV